MYQRGSSCSRSAAERGDRIELVVVAHAERRRPAAAHREADDGVGEVARPVHCSRVGRDGGLVGAEPRRREAEHPNRPCPAGLSKRVLETGIARGAFWVRGLLKRISRCRMRGGGTSQGSRGWRSRSRRAHGLAVDGERSELDGGPERDERARHAHRQVRVGVASDAGAERRDHELVGARERTRRNDRDAARERPRPPCATVAVASSATGVAGASPAEHVGMAGLRTSMGIEAIVALGSLSNT